MIGTLFAQEFRTTKRTLLPAVGIMLLAIIAFFAIAALRVPFIGGLSFGLGIGVTLVFTLVVLAVLVANYWRTMYGAEGYFTMTLPVRGRAIYAAKVLHGLVVGLAALLITLGGLVLAAIAFALMKGQGAFGFLREALTTLDPQMAWFIGGALVLQLVFAVIAGATAMSVGAEARFNHLGFGAPVIGTIVLYFVMQIVNLAGLLFIPIGIRMTGPDVGSLVAEGMLTDFMAAVADPAANSTPSVLGLGVVIMPLIAAALLAWWGARSVDRRTSLR
ncbi:MAG: hypothetical protein KA158_01735 [Leucobacter sp.]|nr:hypothetical protein [Leucobacter sp.]